MSFWGERAKQGFANSKIVLYTKAIEGNQIRPPATGLGRLCKARENP